MYNLPANGLRTRVAKAMVQTPCGLPAGLAMCPMLQSLAETISFGIPLPPDFVQVFTAYPTKGYLNLFRLHVLGLGA